MNTHIIDQESLGLWNAKWQAKVITYNVPLKRQLTLNGLHGVISQKMVLFIVYPNDDFMFSAIFIIKILLEIIYYMELNSQFKILCPARPWLKSSLLMVAKHEEKRPTQITLGRQQHNLKINPTEIDYLRMHAI
jgi:hypothetical protein